MQKHIPFFSRVRNEIRMMVSGLNHLLGRVKRSDLVQNGRDNSLLSRKVPKTRNGRPVEVKLKQTMVGIEVDYGILEQVGSAQHAQK